MRQRLEMHDPQGSVQNHEQERRHEQRRQAAARENGSKDNERYDADRRVHETNK